MVANTKTMIRKGEIHWAELSAPEGSEPGYRRPVVVVQSDLFNQSAVPTVLIVPLSSNLALAKAPGNVRLGRRETGLAKDSVANVSQIIAINRSRLDGLVGELDPALMFAIDNGIRLVFDV